MGKIETYTQNRVEGLAWAYDLIRKADTVEQGVENLRKEVELRRATFIPLELPASHIHAASELLARRLKNIMLLLFLKIFEEEYDWRGKRLRRLRDHIDKHTRVFFDEDPYADRYITFSAYADYFRTTYGIELNREEVGELLSVEALNEEQRERMIRATTLRKMLGNRYPEAWEYLSKELKL